MTTAVANSARALVAAAIADAAGDFPDLDAQSLNTTLLSERDARLALMIHRTVLQRWLTLEYLLDQFLRRPLHKAAPALQGVLLTGAAQLLFMDRLPAHAVVDEAVKLARKVVRPAGAAAAGAVNAVLRRVSELIDAPARGKEWSPAADRLPIEDGWLPLRGECLPPRPQATDIVREPVDIAWARHLAIATSHPARLLRRWLHSFGLQTTIDLCRHNVVTPPIVVSVESGFDFANPARQGEGISADAPEGTHPLGGALPHAQPGHFLWQGDHRGLMQFLAGHPARRVQDVTASLVVKATSQMQPRIVVDYCAGRGTKTLQLAALHPQAIIIATDADGDRLATLRQSCGSSQQIRAVRLDEVKQAVAAASREARPDAAAGADLLLLDVPCSNSGVLARRPEAKYRFSDATLDSLIRLQRGIIEQSWPLLAPGGAVLYSTCSIEREENEEQVRWLVQQRGVRVLQEVRTMPAGAGATYQDGGYFALLSTAPSPMARLGEPSG